MGKYERPFCDNKICIDHNMTMPCDMSVIGDDIEYIWDSYGIVCSHKIVTTKGDKWLCDKCYNVYKEFK